MFKIDSVEYKKLSKEIIALTHETEKLHTKLQEFEHRFRKLEGRYYAMKGTPTAEEEPKDLSFGNSAFL